MRSIDRFALSFTPMLLRLAIGLTFLWAGAGKLFHQVQFSEADRAILTQIETGAPAPAQPNAETTAPDPEDEIPALPEPDPADTPPADDAPADEEGDDSPRLRSLTEPSARALPSGYSLTLAQDAAPSDEPGTNEPTPNEESAGEAGELITDAFADPPAETDTPEDVSETVGANVSKDRFLNRTALTIYGAAHPEKGKPRLPAFMGVHAIKLAWAVAIIEFAGGLFILLGFLTRVWALAITGVIAGALWSTELGPAMLGGLDQTFLGFLPPLWPFNPGAAMHFLWLLLLTLASFSLVFLGAGAFSIDRLLFGHPSAELEIYTPPTGKDD